MHVYSGIPRVNRGNKTGKMLGDTPDSGWRHLKVGIRCVLFLVEISKISLKPSWNKRCQIGIQAKGSIRGMASRKYKSKGEMVQNLR